MKKLLLSLLFVLPASGLAGGGGNNEVLANSPKDVTLDNAEINDSIMVRYNGVDDLCEVIDVSNISVDCYVSRTVICRSFSTNFFINKYVCRRLARAGNVESPGWNEPYDQAQRIIVQDESITTILPGGCYIGLPQNSYYLIEKFTVINPIHLKAVGILAALASSLYIAAQHCEPVGKAISVGLTNILIK